MHGQIKLEDICCGTLTIAFKEEDIYEKFI
jgi:hypothetical protein